MPDDSRNLGKEFNERHSPNKLEFITDRYHVLREIYQKFGRVSSVKRISLYLKSRARPVKKTHFYNSQSSQLRSAYKLQKLLDRDQFQGTNQSIKNLYQNTDIL